MGLDFAEFVITVEDELGIGIVSNDLGHFKDLTVGDMVDLIEKKIREKQSEEILSEQYPQIVAEEIEKTLKLAVPHLSFPIRQETLMSDLFPEKIAWNQFLESKDPVVLEIESAVSTFVNHRKVSNLSLKLYLVFIAICVLLLLLMFDGSIYIALLLVPITGYIWLKISLKIIYGLNAKALKRITFADVVQRVTEDRLRYAVNDGQNYRFHTREEIEQHVIKIISDVTAIKIEKITLDKTFVRDLKMG